jgi:hypothetical protein
MATNNFFHSDLYHINHIIQNSMTLYPKELVIETMRDFFSRDSYYHYVKDAWGFPKTPDLTDAPRDVGLYNNISTRLFIGESYRFNVIYYPAIIVKHGGATSVPISINREAYSVIWGDLVFEDGYGHVKTFPTPLSFMFAGAWEGSINIEVRARDLRARDELTDLISVLFTDVSFNDLYKSGLIIKGLSSSPPSETDDRNDHIFTQTITLQVRSEWRRAIPIYNTIDIINFSLEFGRLEPTPGPIATNLTISTQETIQQLLMNL